jgi:(p)ppGpp synthase/HD superfamily hydrolase
MSMELEHEELVELCRLLAKFLQRDQVDKQGVPYFFHLEAVADKVHSAALKVPGGFRAELIGAALLHDVLEDTDLKWDCLSEVVPTGVASLVNILTRRTSSKFGFDETYHEYIARVSQSSDATAIKLADLEHNMERMESLREPERSGLRQRYERAHAYLTAAQAARTSS